MKRLTVVVTATYLVPNSYRVVEHAVDGGACLEIRGRSYLPGLFWLEFRVDPENPPHGPWVQDNDMTEAIESHMTSEGAEFTLEDAP